MSFSIFFQQNIILFIAGFGILAFLLFLELRGLKTRGVTLTPALLTQQVNRGAKLIDLRDTSAYQAGHITGAKNLPLETLKDQLNTLGKKESPIVLYCQRGQTSARGVSVLQQAGFTQVSHLGGGLNAWQQDNLPLVSS